MKENIQWFGRGHDIRRSHRSVPHYPEQVPTEIVGFSSKGIAKDPDRVGRALNAVLENPPPKGAA